MVILMKGPIFSVLLIASSINGTFGQTRVVQWKDLPNQSESVFPLAYRHGTNNAEEAINAYLQKRYLHHEESYRDSFYEYRGLNPTANVSGVAITYEHEFNTAPGLKSFTDLHYFDLRSGEKVSANRLFHTAGQREFIEMMNERKNAFVNEFRATISKDQEDYRKLIEIVEYTINDTFKLADIDNGYGLVIERDSLRLTKDWEYDWGIGRHELPYMTLKCSYQEIAPMLNGYGKGLLLVPTVVPENKLFYGFIGGKYEVSALVRGADDSTKITYWYESNKTPISWTGEIGDNQFLLSERGEDSEERATVELSFYQEKGKMRAVGEWHDLLKKKSLTIELFEY